MKTGNYYNEGDLPWSVQVPQGGTLPGLWWTIARFSDEAATWEYAAKFSSAKVACREIVIGYRVNVVPPSRFWESPSEKAGDR
jgi:hypothetical protein